MTPQATLRDFEHDLDCLTEAEREVYEAVEQGNWGRVRTPMLRTVHREPSVTCFDALRVPGELTVSFPFQEEPAAQGGNGNQMGWMTDEVEAAVQGGESA